MQPDFEQILAADLSETEKLTQAFKWITDQFLQNTGQELELRQALGDQQGLIKEQIKLSMMQHAREIFQFCHLRVTGRKAWDE